MGKKTWTDDEKQKLVELYPTHTDKELCNILGKRITQLRGMKERLGLRDKYTGKKNLLGNQYGLLTVISEAEKTPGSGNTRWNCKCEKCGKIIPVTQYLLENSDPYSHCVCTKKSKCGNDNPAYKHGGHGTRLYSIWNGMHTRITNVKSWNYKYYGERGIHICDEWQDFANFQKWAIENGYSDDLSIDRIDPNGNYEPSNCRWATQIEQQNNRRNNIHKS